MLLLLAVAVFLGVSLAQSFDRYQVAADDDLENLTLNLERYLFTRLQAADLVLQSAAQSFALMSAAGPVSETEFNAALFELQKRLPDAPALRAADHTGLVLYGGGVDPAQRLSVERRQFFQEAKSSSTMVLGLPLKSRITGRWVLPLAQQLRDHRNAFAGVVYINLDLEELNGFFGSLKLGAQGVITLFNARREVLLRLPAAPMAQDEQPVRVAAPEVLNSLASGKPADRFRTRSSIDSVLRAVMYRQVGGYSVFILAGLAEADFRAPGTGSWRSRWRSGSFWRVRSVCCWCSSTGRGAASCGRCGCSRRPRSRRCGPMTRSRCSWPTSAMRSARPSTACWASRRSATAIRRSLRRRARSSRASSSPASCCRAF
ncbi:MULTISPECIES: cache domain-containing protein [unclassified Methylibium]|uniref:cache domain-containing protein n=1 Tax=unclassified Methylibium TaxID=2633235 RepID=UPI00068632E6|nr:MULTISPECIES: cache domain-containing protein [unclassified Methylibium]